jgi:hypothetical protein
MRTLFSWMMATLDGFDEGPHRSFDFWNIDAEFHDLSVRQLDEADTLELGCGRRWPARDFRAPVGSRRR